ncbi:MAG: hypothetical protein R3C39_03025 [Dehalococcoidia bacterium]
MTDNERAPRSDSPPRQVLLRRLADAQAILGCGDDPDRSAAIDEVERLERALSGVDGGEDGDVLDEPNE